MDKRALVETEIQRIAATTPNAIERYTNGDCYKFHMLLKAKFPDARAWYDRIEGHVLTELYGKLWDITGWVWTVRKEPPHVVRWEELEEFIQNDAPNWAWSPRS